MVGYTLKQKLLGWTHTKLSRLQRGFLVASLMSIECYFRCTAGKCTLPFAFHIVYPCLVWARKYACILC